MMLNTPGYHISVADWFTCNNNKEWCSIVQFVQYSTINCWRLRKLSVACADNVKTFTQQRTSNDWARHYVGLELYTAETSLCVVYLSLTALSSSHIT